MYIGPWQEYNLGKTAVAKGNQDNQDLKQNLKKALLQSLDPVAAQQALQAMDAVLDNIHPAKIQTSRTNHSTTNYSTKEKKQQPSPAPTPREKVNRKKYVTPLELPDVASSPMSRCTASNISTNTPSKIDTPHSYRTSLSEPIRGTQLLSDRRVSARSTGRHSSEYNEMKLPTREAQPPYNAQGAIGLLKLERSTRLSKTQKPDFSQFWDWGASKNKTDIPPSELPTGLNTKRKSGDKGLQDRISKVQQMEKLYKIPGNLTTTGNIAFDDELPDESLSRAKDRLEPISVSTPIVKERDLTDKDIQLVAKYFDKMEPANASMGKAPSKTSLANSLHHRHLERPYVGDGIAQVAHEGESMSRSNSSDKRRFPGPSHLGVAVDSSNTNFNSSFRQPLTMSPIRERESLSRGSNSSSRGGLLPPLPVSAAMLSTSDALHRHGSPLHPLHSNVRSNGVSTPLANGTPGRYDDVSLLRWSLDLDIGNIDSLY